MSALHRILGCLVLAALLCTGSSMSSASSKTGTTTANFLKLGVGARGEALAGAYTALADDATALYWNPAGLTRIPEQATTVTLMHAPYVDPTYFDFVGLARNAGTWGAFGAGLQYFSGGSVTQTDTSGTAIGSFSPYDLAASLAYARCWSGYGFGVTGKFIRSQLYDSAQAMAFDVGVLTPDYFDDKLRFALVGTNIGTRMTFDQESYGLPRNLKVGSAYKITRDWSAVLDLNVPGDNDPYVALGSEYRWALSTGWTLTGRLGYNTRTGNDLDGVTGITAGFGIQLKTYSFDYAMVPMGSLGLTQRLSISLKFQPRRTEPPQPQLQTNRGYSSTNDPYLDASPE